MQLAIVTAQDYIWAQIQAVLTKCIIVKSGKLRKSFPLLKPSKQIILNKLLLKISYGQESNLVTI